MRYFVYGAILVLLASLLTGVTQVRRGERAVVRRFGRVLEDKPRPGLLIGLPWGMDQVDRVAVDRVQRVKVGYDPGAEQPEGTVPPGQLLTGDHNLVNVQVVIDYSVNENELEQYVLQRDRVDGLVARTTEAVLAEWLAARPVDDVLLNGKALLPPYLKAETQYRLDQGYKLGVQVQDANVVLLQPPDQVKDAFEEVNKAEAEIQTNKNKAEQDAAQTLAGAETERNRIQREAEAFAAEQRQLALTEAANFRKRLAEYRRFRATNPDYLHDIWFNEIKKVYARMQQNGGRIEPLDRFVGRDGVDMIRVPIPERKK